MNMISIIKSKVSDVSDSDELQTPKALYRELKDLRRQHQLLSSSLQFSHMQLTDVQSERKALLYILHHLTTYHQELIPVVEDLKIEYDYVHADDSVTEEEYNAILQENEELRSQLNRNPTYADESIIKTKLQMEVLRLSVENLALKSGAERKEAELNARRSIARQFQYHNLAFKIVKSNLFRKSSEVFEWQHNKLKGRQHFSKNLVSNSSLLGKANIIMESLSTICSMEKLSDLDREKKLSMIGAFSYDSADEDLLIERLILDVWPNDMIEEAPGMIGHILFMCIRYLDHTNNDLGLQSLLKKAIFAIQTVIKDETTNNTECPNLDILVFWLGTCCRLLGDMKQYSGDAKYPTTTRVGQTPLQNFDLSDYRTVLSDLCIMIHKLLLKLLQEEIGPISEAALLYHNELTESATTEATPWGDENIDEAEIAVTVNSLILWFEETKAIFGRHFLDPEITQQTIYIVVSHCFGRCFNHLITTPELCTDRMALKIAYNLQQFCMYVEKENKSIKKMSPLTQLMEALLVLELPKVTSDNIDLICQTCLSLEVCQIRQLLILYTDESGQHIPARIIEEGLTRRWEQTQARIENPQPLLLDLSKSVPIVIPYTSKDILLVDINPPDFLGLDMLTKI